jgi:hypothetical protein
MTPPQRYRGVRGRASDCEWQMLSYCAGARPIGAARVELTRYAALPPVDADDVCIDRASGFKWHSTFAGLFFMLYLLYMARVTLHCSHLRATAPPGADASDGIAAVSASSLRAKLVATGG